MHKYKIILSTIVVGITLSLSSVLMTKASDHDDGEMEQKGRALNLTDLYVFREDWQDQNGSPSNLVLVMNTNPRSLARQQYHFSSQARYEFHLSRVSAADKSARPTGKEDVVMRLEFGAPDSGNRQPITLTAIRDGKEIKAGAGFTTSLADMNLGKVTLNSTMLDGSNISVFAGLREDPFFFDVERFFRVRGLLATGANTLGSAPTQGGANVFRADSAAVDFTAGYNVNSIVLRVPMSFLQTSANEPVFDVWETISIPQ